MEQKGAASFNELSGTVLGPSVQAGTIHGDVNFHGTGSRPAPVPRQLLAPPPYFTNRREELVRLDELIAGTDLALAVLTGPGGVGKTALARQWAHAVQSRFTDGQLYLDLGGFSGPEPVPPEAALAAFLRALGTPPHQVPVVLAEQAALYRSITTARSLLVVLDNAYSAAQVRVLVPGPGRHAVVVTSRRRLIGLLPDGAKLIDVAPLPTVDSVRLLARAIGAMRVAKEHAQAEELARICGGLPIALCMAAARLAARPQWSVGRMAAELTDETSRLSALSVREGLSVQAVFDVSYRLLDTEPAMLHRRLALHPGPEFGLGPAAAVWSATGAGAGESDRLVDLLLEANLLQEVAEDRFRFHDLLRLHARQKAEAEDAREDREMALRAMLEWYLAAAGRADMTLTPYRRRLPYRPVTTPIELPTLSTRDEALDWLELERVNLIRAGQVALEYGLPELAWQLSYVLWPLFLYRKHFPDRMESDRRGLVAARAWGNVWAEAAMLKRLCGACAAAGDDREAEQHVRRAIQMCETSGDARGAVDAREALAMLYRDFGRPAQAADIFAEVLAANRHLGDDRCTGLTLINLGMLLPALGRPAEAVPLLQEARELFATLSHIDPYNEVRVVIGLAGALLGVGDLLAAEQAAASAARRMRELGSEHGRAEALHIRGQVAERRGDPETAQRYYRLAYETFDALGSAHAPVVHRRLTPT